MSKSHYFSLPAWLSVVPADPFKRYLIIFLFLLGLLLYSTEEYQSGTSDPTVKQVSFFFHPLCPHCQRQKRFNAYLKAKYPELKWAEYDTSIRKNALLLNKFIERSGNNQDRSVPKTYIGPYEISGFDTEKTTGVTLEKAIQAYLANDPLLFDEKKHKWKPLHTVKLPFFGEIDYSQYSLLSLSVILGLVDGFNPCAMWVLVYLISLIMTLKERKKIWFLVGTFILTSGVLYFLFLAAWLNVFLFLGYLRILTLVIGLIAVGVGVVNIREYLRTRTEPVCEIGNAESKKKTMGQVDKIVRSPLSLFTIASIITLAFVVNSIEFACSAALPAIFTHALTLGNLTTFQHYAYILIYDLFFMLDDLIIFSLAVFSLETDIGRRYLKHSKIIAGVVLLILGGVMLFYPEMLR